MAASKPGFLDQYGADPLGNFNFWVMIDGEDGIKARFAEVSGLKADVEELEIKEGGVNNRTHKIPGRVIWGPVTLKKGLGDEQVFMNWWRKVVDRDPTGAANGVHKNVDIVLLDRDMSERRRWKLQRAWPKSWEGSALSAGGSDMAFETLVLSHEGITETKQ
jgi:phage tail-like protein